MAKKESTPQDLDGAPVKDQTDNDPQECAETGQKDDPPQNPNGAPVKDPPVKNMGEALELVEKMLERGDAEDSGWIQGIDKQEDMGRNHRSSQMQVRGWAHNWAITKHQYINLLSKDQKQAIIHNLEGSCVQEDWDVLLSRLQDRVQESITNIFLETLILRKIHIQLFEAPFWYLDGKLAPDGDGNDRDETFPPRLQRLYERFLKSMRMPITPSLSF